MKASARIQNTETQRGTQRNIRCRMSSIKSAPNTVESSEKTISKYWSPTIS
jgi:hypothetical protein